MDCHTFANEEKIAVVVPVTGAEAEVTCSKAMFALTLSTSLLKCLMKEKAGKVSTRVNVWQHYRWMYV